jgi:cysteine-rich repeat protein
MSRARAPWSFVVLLSTALACGDDRGARDEASAPALRGATQAATAPAGFVDELWASGLTSPTAFAFAADGRIFVAEQAGLVRVVQDGALRAEPLVSLPAVSDGEGGLLGIAVDPNFSSNPYVYVSYTASTSVVRNRISRLRVEGNVASPNSELVLLELDDVRGCTIHFGGALQFGADGLLYIGVGDTCEPTHAQRFDRFAGKLLRIRADGGLPADNPFVGMTSGNYRAIWARGLRNPYTFAVSHAGRIIINDVGLAGWEEINEGRAGANYGWPESEGVTNIAGHTSPLFAYPHSGAGLKGCAITGGTFYEPPQPQFPSSFVGKYLFADYCTNFIRILDLNGYQSAPFVESAAGVVDLRVGPDGQLYRLERATNSIYRLRYAASGEPPSIDAAPADRTVAAGANVTLTVRASGTPPLRYRWQRDGVDIAGATLASYAFTAQASDDGSVFRVVVTNDLGMVTSAGARLRVVQNSAPSATIHAPAAGSAYSAGLPISYSGSAEDAEDGALPASEFTWEVVLHHDAHTHPFLAPFSGQTSGTFVVPRIGHTETNVFYRIHLRVRDSTGLEASTFRDISPRLATLALRTQPAGLSVTLDGSPVVTPTDVLSVVGVTRTIGAVTPQARDGVSYTFQSWSNSGQVTHAIDTPGQSTTYTASFRAGCEELALRPLSASSSSDESADLRAESAIDGNLGTRWSSAFSDPQWLSIDLGASRSLSRVVLRWEVAHARDYQLQIADSASGPYQTVATRTHFGGGTDTFSALAARGRYLRIYASARATMWGNSLWEVELFGPPASCEGGASVCGNGALESGEQCDDGNTTSGDGCSTSCSREAAARCVAQPLPRLAAQASSHEAASLGAPLAIDGAFGTRWASAALDEQWLRVDLGAPRYLNRALLHWEVSYASDYRLEVAADPNGPWTTIATRSGFTGGADYFTRLGARGRYLRLYAMRRAAPRGISLWELELFGDPNPSCLP